MVGGWQKWRLWHVPNVWFGNFHWELCESLTGRPRGNWVWVNDASWGAVTPHGEARTEAGRTEAGKNATAENGRRDGTVGAATLKNATAENRTRVSRVAGENSTTRPRLLFIYDECYTVVDSKRWIN